MKKLLILTAILPVLLLTTSLVSGCQTILVSNNGETETGETETRQYDLSEFTRVDISSAFSYEILQSDIYSVSVTANSNLFDDIKVTKEGQTLILDIDFPNAPWTLFNNNPRLKAVISMPQLQGLDSSGATQGIVTGFGSTGNLDVTISGASSVEMNGISAGNAYFGLSGASEVTGDITAEYVEFEISGASTAQMKGSAGSITADASGASDLQLADLEVKNASITLSGASNGTINVTGSLDADLSGASNLDYIGNPSLGIMHISGASDLERK